MLPEAGAGAGDNNNLGDSMQPDLENLKKRIGESKDLVDRLIGKLPGYTGYVEKGEMYEADRVVRGFIAEKLLSYKRVIDGVIREQSKKSEMKYLSDLESINTLLEKAHKKSAFAESGRSAGASKISVSQDDLNKILEFDWRMIGKVDELEPEIVKIESVEGDALAAEIKRIRKLIEDFEKAFDQRKNVILEVI